MAFSRGLLSGAESELFCWKSVGDGEGNRDDFLGVDGEESAEEGGLSGSIISGFVRVGDGGAIGTRGLGRMCILKGYMAH